MSDQTPHGRHVQAIGFAGLEVERFEQAIQNAYISGEEVFSTVVRTTGVDPVHPSAKAAQTSLLAASERLAEAVALCEETKAHLNDYSGSF